MEDGLDAPGSLQLRKQVEGELTVQIQVVSTMTRLPQDKVCTHTFTSARTCFLFATQKSFVDCKKQASLT